MGGVSGVGEGPWGPQGEGARETTVGAQGERAVPAAWAPAGDGEFVSPLSSDAETRRGLWEVIGMR